jgi:hypothetical protein
MTTKEINAKLEIVNLEGKKFPAPGGYYETKGFALRHPELGYFAFKCDSPVVPYSPLGGKKALQLILDAGGFTSFDDCVWLQEFNGNDPQADQPEDSSGDPIRDNMELHEYLEMMAAADEGSEEEEEENNKE